MIYRGRVYYVTLLTYQGLLLLLQAQIHVS